MCFLPYVESRKKKRHGSRRGNIREEEGIRSRGGGYNRVIENTIMIHYMHV
jgi:hypothetical protein